MLIGISSLNAGRRVFIPKSERLILVVALKPAVILLMGLIPILLRVTSNVTGLEIPFRVSVPVTLAVLLFMSLMTLLTNVAVGNCDTLKKQGPLRCLSNSGTPVMILAV